MASYYGDRARDVPTWDSLDTGEEDDVVDTSEYAYASRDHVLFCIDASKSMHTPRPDSSNPDGIVRGKSALQQVLEAVVDLERRKVVTGPSDSVGVMFWNVDPTAESSGGNYKPGTAVYQPLRTINAEDMKRLIKLVEAAQDEYAAQEDEQGETAEPKILRDAFPPAKAGDELNIADVLVTCNFLFRDAGTKLNGNKRVFMITDNDDPPGSSSNREPARTVYGDLLTYGITINTFFIDKADHHFDPSLYWNDVLARDESAEVPENEQGEPEGLDKLADLLTDLAIRNAPKRTQWTIPLRLGGADGDIEIGVSGYSIVSEQGKGQPKYVRMRGQVVEEVVTKTEYASAETGAVLRQDEISHAFKFGNEATVPNVLQPNWWESDQGQEVQRRIVDEGLRLETERGRRNGDHDDEKPRGIARTRLEFSPDEVREFKTLGLSPQIKILGFQAPGNLAIEDNIKHSYFIYPDEDTYSGSTRTFAALLKSCLKKNKHALALCRFRANSTPEFAVLIPQKETFTEGGGQDMPPGFHVIILPFADDIRAPPKNMTDNLTATELESKLMGNIVKRLRNKAGRYRSEVYPNPSLQYHYAQLQALAFEEDFDLSEKIDEIDKTYPKHHGMHRAAGDFMAEWNQAINEDERAVDSLKAATKRAPAPLIDEEDLANVRGAWKDETINKLKIVQLKDYAKFHGVPLGGKTKKADVIEILSAWFDKGGGQAKKARAE